MLYPLSYEGGTSRIARVELRAAGSSQRVRHRRGGLGPPPGQRGMLLGREQSTDGHQGSGMSPACD
jgi:hypothetical protein